MAEVRNVFIKSKMNKDLDERLLPSGEYREGRNISISKSEGPDEGVVENILGNIKYSNFNFASKTEIIGTYVDTDKDRIYIFATNFLDSSQDQLSNFPVDNVPHPAGGVIPIRVNASGDLIGHSTVSLRSSRVSHLSFVSLRYENPSLLGATGEEVVRKRPVKERSCNS